jgi:predicted nucleic acid-binding protein
MNVVIDTSVAAAWYLEEAFSRPAREWQQKLLSGQAHGLVPALHYLEFANVLRSYLRRREIGKELAAELYAIHLDAPLDVVEPHRGSLLSTAIEFDTTVYDAAFISLALNYECPLVTAERSTTPWVVKLGKLGISIG